MADIRPDTTPIQQLIVDIVPRHRKAFLIQGVAFVVLGIAAVVMPQIASIAIDVLIGWLLIIAAVARLSSLGTDTSLPGYWPSLLVAVLTAILGAVLALLPVPGVLSLSVILVVYFLAHGLGSIGLAGILRTGTSRWFGLLVSGVIDFVLVGIILAGWPETALWAPGLMLGVNLIITGVALLALARR